jgi:hypothetical protein
LVPEPATEAFDAVVVPRCARRVPLLQGVRVCSRAGGLRLPGDRPAAVTMIPAMAPVRRDGESATRSRSAASARASVSPAAPNSADRRTDITPVRLQTLRCPQRLVSPAPRA